MKNHKSVIAKWFLTRIAELLFFGARTTFHRIKLIIFRHNKTKLGGIRVLSFAGSWCIKKENFRKSIIATSPTQFNTCFYTSRCSKTYCKQWGIRWYELWEEINLFRNRKEMQTIDLGRAVPSRSILASFHLKSIFH